MTREDRQSTETRREEAKTVTAVLALSTAETDVASLLASALGAVAAGFRVSVQGHRVILRGNAPSYAEKARAEQCLRAAGYHEVDNCLRVVPSISIIS